MTDVANTPPSDLRAAAVAALGQAAHLNDPRNKANASGQYAIAAALVYIGDELRTAREARAREIGGGPSRGF